MKTRVAVAVLTVLFVAPLVLGSCVRKARMTGTYDGEWSDGLSDELTIEGDGAGALVIECDDCAVQQDELEAEITAAHEFEVDTKNIQWTGRNYQGNVDIEGEGDVRNGGELELDVDVIFPNGQSASLEFEGDKE